MKNRLLSIILCIAMVGAMIVPASAAFLFAVDMFDILEFEIELEEGAPSIEVVKMDSPQEIRAAIGESSEPRVYVAPIDDALYSNAELKTNVDNYNAEGVFYFEANAAASELLEQFGEYTLHISIPDVSTDDEVIVKYFDSASTGLDGVFMEADVLEDDVVTINNPNHDGTILIEIFRSNGNGSWTILPSPELNDLESDGINIYIVSVSSAYVSNLELEEKLGEVDPGEMTSNKLTYGQNRYLLKTYTVGQATASEYAIIAPEQLTKMMLFNMNADLDSIISAIPYDSDISDYLPAAMFYVLLREDSIPEEDGLYHVVMKTVGVSEGDEVVVIGIPEPDVNDKAQQIHSILLRAFVTEEGKLDFAVPSSMPVLILVNPQGK